MIYRVQLVPSQPSSTPIACPSLLARRRKYPSSDAIEVALSRVSKHRRADVAKIIVGDATIR